MTRSKIVLVLVVITLAAGWGLACTGISRRITANQAAFDRPEVGMPQSQLAKTEVVDFVTMSASREDGSVHLVASDPCDTAGKGRMLLQAKLKNYVTFVKDGQLERNYPETRGKRVRIQIDAAFALGDLEEQLVIAARTEWCEPEDIELVVAVATGINDD